MEKNIYYNKIEDLVNKDHLSLQLLISPPRTCSSMLEKMIGKAPEIKVECHEPFIQVGYNKHDPDEGYKNIYESIVASGFESFNGRLGVVVKEMAYWLNDNAEYRRLFKLTNKPVVALIRNPLLAMESRMIKVLEAIDMRERIKTQQWLLDYVARERGFFEWQEYITSLTAEDFKKDVIMLLIFKRHSVAKEAYNNPILNIQNGLLDHIARKDRYKNWRELIHDKLHVNKDYKYFEDILKIDTKRFNLDISGFKAIEDQIHYLESIKKPFIIIDSTDLRATPESQMKEICRFLRITYLDKMIRWGEEGISFYTNQKRPHDLLWYSELYLSTQINPPIEVSPTLSEFPEFVQRLVKSVELPVYGRLSQKKIGLEGNLNLNEFEFELNCVPAKIRTQEIKWLGVIRNDFEEIKQKLKLKIIDPIYAITNHPGLFNDEEFKEIKKEYLNEMSVVREAINKINKNN